MIEPSKIRHGKSTDWLCEILLSLQGVDWIRWLIFRHSFTPLLHHSNTPSLRTRPNLVVRRLVVLFSIPLLVNSRCAANPEIIQDVYTQAESITDMSVELPVWNEILRVVTLQDYNTRVVVVGTMLLGLAAGMIGTFILLRKRSLMGDAVSHATLPGIGIAFIVMTYFGGGDKSLPGLLAGALISGLIGTGCILFIRNMTRLKEDAALGIVLSVFFGLGIAIMGIIQKMSTGHAAGLESFIYGKTASMLASDAQLIAIVAAVVALACCVLYKEFTILCFDQDFAASQRWPVVMLDAILMILVVTVTVIGLQAVGLILVIALLIIPAAAARFWSDKLSKMLLLAGSFGAVSGIIGTALSALIPRLPAGAIIVIVAAGLFVLSLVFGSARGLLRRCLQYWKLNRKIGMQNLLRAMYEIGENRGATLSTESRPEGNSFEATWDELMAARSWSSRYLKRLLKQALRKDLLTELAPFSYRFTKLGMVDARRIVRNHRLWEIYLITHADVATSKVDRDADRIEHVLGKVMVERLESILTSQYPHIAVPSSPHVI